MIEYEDTIRRLQNERTDLRIERDEAVKKWKHYSDAYDTAEAACNENIKKLADLDKELEKVKFAWDAETCSTCHYMRSPVVTCKCGQLAVAGTNDRLRREIEELRVDKERLDGLERHGDGICLIHDDHSRWACGLAGVQPVTGEDGKSICDGPIGGAWTYFAEPEDWKDSLRAAIDQFRAESDET